MNTGAPRIFSRAVIHRVNQNLIAQQRVDMTPLPRRVSDSIRATRFTTEQLNRAFANARLKSTPGH